MRLPIELMAGARAFVTAGWGLSCRVRFSCNLLSGLSVAGALLVASPVMAEIVVRDGDGSNDVREEIADLTLAAIDYSQTPTGLVPIVIQIEASSVLAGQTVRASVLFDTDRDGNANCALLATLAGGAGNAPQVRMDCAPADASATMLSVDAVAVDAGRSTVVSGLGVNPWKPQDRDIRLSLKVDFNAMAQASGVKPAAIRLLNVVTVPGGSIGAEATDRLLGSAAPYLSSSFAQTRAGVPVTIKVLAYASERIGAGTVRISSAPGKGVARANPDGTVTYSPNPGQVGNDKFQYECQAIDGEFYKSEVTISIIENKNNNISVFDKMKTEI